MSQSQWFCRTRPKFGVCKLSHAHARDIFISKLTGVPPRLVLNAPIASQPGPRRVSQIGYLSSAEPVEPMT